MYHFWYDSNQLVNGENISHYHLMNLSGTHEYNKQCYLKVDVNSVLDNDTAYCYSTAVSIIGGLGATFQSMLGSFLNILVILALLNDASLRKEYLTPSIISLASTDLLFSMFSLPMVAIRYFVKYVYLNDVKMLSLEYLKCSNFGEYFYFM